MQPTIDAAGLDVATTATPATSDAPQPSPRQARIGAIRVAIVDNLLRSEADLSDVARREAGFDARAWLRRDRYISSLAIPFAIAPAM